MHKVRSLNKFLVRNTKKKLVFFVRVHQDSGHLIATLSDMLKKANNPSVVCLNTMIPHFLQGLTGDIKLSDAYLKDFAYEEIDDFVYALTKNWHWIKKQSLQDIMEYHGIRMGSIVEYDFQRFLIRRIKILAILTALIKNENPAGLIIFSDVPDEFLGIIELLREKFSIKIFTVFKKNKNNCFLNTCRGIKAFIGDSLSTFIDCIIRIFLLRKGKLAGKILVDTRIYDDLSRHVPLPGNFLPMPYEKGLKLRIRLIRDKLFYPPFYFPSVFSFSFFLRGFLKSKRIKKSLAGDGLFKFQGLPVWKIAEPAIKLYLRETFPRIKKNIVFFELFWKRNPVGAFVMRHDLWELQRLSVELARRFKIASIVVQHGVLGEKGERIIFADKMAVWGQLYVDMYRVFGNDTSKCRVTGNPRHDVFFNHTPVFSKREICNQLNLDTEKDIVLLLSDPCNSILSSYANEDRAEVIIEQLVKAMQDFPDKQLVIKLHPYERPGFSEGVIKYAGLKNVTVVKCNDLYSLLNASDLVITKESSVGLKAMILNKPLMVINFEKREDVVPYAASGAALGVYNPDAVLPEIKRAFSDCLLKQELQVKSRKFVIDYAYRIDGQSSKRVIDFIQEVT